jgi:hypothetical protein
VAEGDTVETTAAGSRASWTRRDQSRRGLIDEMSGNSVKEVCA